MTPITNINHMGFCGIFPDKATVREILLFIWKDHWSGLNIHGFGYSLSIISGLLSISTMNNIIFIHFDKNNHLWLMIIINNNNDILLLLLSSSSIGWFNCDLTQVTGFWHGRLSQAVAGCRRARVSWHGSTIALKARWF